MKGIKVLIADDSVLYRSQIREAITGIPGVECVGAMINGLKAVERLQQISVDLLILDLEMPEMDGLQTLEELRSRHIRTPVLVFSAASKKGAEVALEALRLGAKDFIAKPGPEETKGSDLTPAQRIRALLEPKITNLFPRQSHSKQILNHVDPQHSGKYPRVIWELFNPKVLVIGSSTGGPTALETIFSQLEGPLRCPILIAQHMPPIFTATLAERIQNISGIRTMEGRHDMDLEPNTIYIAPGDYHMSISGTKEKPKIVLDQGPLVNSVRPAVDVLFASAVHVFKDKVLGVVLTGMGADGKVGAEQIKHAGGAVVIQDELSCVVFGMPGAVKDAGAFDRILTPEEIVETISDKCASKKIHGFKKTSLSGGR